MAGAEVTVCARTVDEIEATAETIRRAGFRAETMQADVTDATEEDIALLKRFNLIGPPATLFFGIDQKEQTAYRVIGFKDAAQFLAGIETM